MTFTEEDIPLMKLIFNPTTHDMGMLVGGERAKQIFDYVCVKIKRSKVYFNDDTSYFYEQILINQEICDFFWNNNIIPISQLERYNVYKILMESPIVEKIWESNKLDLSKLRRTHINNILEFSPIGKNFWESDKLNLSILLEVEIRYFKKKFDN